ncbi:MAG: hypothetical protein NTW86_23945 [Candidatus Sumerlaeota bacterium]|nr:hypothetical protein [Candidatus Sumerlaeota bacterium]
MTRSLFQWLLISVGALALGACVSIRGPIDGVAGDTATGKGAPNVLVYHYVKVKTQIPFQTDSSSKLDALSSRWTDANGGFHVGRTWVWLFPFVQSVEEERLILNLQLRSDLLEKSVDDAVYAGYWGDPQFLLRPNANLVGAILGMRSSLFGRRCPFVAPTSVAPGNAFYRATTDERWLSWIPLFRYRPRGILETDK